jgi:hypothetical protein
MVGNGDEWTGDLVETGPFFPCPTFLGDESCFGGPEFAAFPEAAAPVRGVGQAGGAGAGVFAVHSDRTLGAALRTGFRCARDARK